MLNLGYSFYVNYEKTNKLPVNFERKDEIKFICMNINYITGIITETYQKISIFYKNGIVTQVKTKIFRFVVGFIIVVSAIFGRNSESSQANLMTTNIYQKTLVEQVIQLPIGGAINRPWSPLAKYKSKNTTATANTNLRRRLFEISGPVKKGTHQGSGLGYRKSQGSVLSDNEPKFGRARIKVKSIATVDENGNPTTIYYDKDGNITNIPPESEFFVNDDGVNLSSDSNSNLTDQSISSETENENSGLTKARNQLDLVTDDRLVAEGDVLNPSRLTTEGRKVVDKTKTRRIASLVQSQFEDRENQVFPVYSIQQILKKDEHIIQVLEKLNENITRYNELPLNNQAQVGINIVESLLAHPDTEFYPIAIAQSREPISIALNRGQGNYSLKNHMATFERRPEICKYNPYISNYLLRDEQLENFDRSNNISTVYEDLVGNPHNETGPIIGSVAPKSPTLAPKASSTNSASKDDTEL